MADVGLRVGGGLMIEGGLSVDRGLRVEGGLVVERESAEGGLRWREDLWRT